MGQNSAEIGISHPISHKGENPAAGEAIAFLRCLANL